MKAYSNARTLLAQRANAVGRRHDSPVLLSHDSDAYAVSRWLQWCDPKRGERAWVRTATYTEEEAWEALERMLDQ